MKIGDSFLIPKSKDEEGPSLQVLRQRVSGIIGTTQRRTNLRFSTAIMPDGVRVWRIANRKPSNLPVHNISDEGIEKIAAAQRRRWAKFKEAKKRKQ